MIDYETVAVVAAIVLSGTSTWLKLAAIERTIGGLVVKTDIHDTKVQEHDKKFSMLEQRGYFR